MPNFEVTTYVKEVKEQISVQINTLKMKQGELFKFKILLLFSRVNFS